MGVVFDAILGKLRMKDKGEVTTAQLTTETNARILADSNEATARANADSAEATARANADTAETNARVSADNTLQSNITAEAVARAAADSALDTRTTTLENNEYKILYYASVSATSGTLALPANTTVILNDFPQGIDAIVETIVNGEPSALSAYTAGGVAVTVTSFDTAGNYVLSGTPSAYPVALLFILKVKAIYLPNLTFDNIIDAQDQKGTSILPGTGDRMVEAAAGGQLSATKAIVDAYITDATLIAALQVAANWTGSPPTYTGPSGVSGGYQGQFFFGAVGAIPYLFLCKADQVWTRWSLTDTTQLSEGGTNNNAIATTASGMIRMNAAGTAFENSALLFNQSLQTTNSPTFNTVTATFSGSITTAVFSMSAITPAQYTANQNNLAWATTSNQRISSNAAINITGLSATGNGKFYWIRNVGTFAITFTHEDAASTAANRLTSSTGANIVLNAGGCLCLMYDNTTTRWFDVSLR